MVRVGSRNLQQIRGDGGHFCPQKRVWFNKHGPLPDEILDDGRGTAGANVDPRPSRPPLAKVIAGRIAESDFFIFNLHPIRGSMSVMIKGTGHAALAAISSSSRLPPESWEIVGGPDHPRKCPRTDSRD
jgi:hypothetical protein